MQNTKPTGKFVYIHRWINITNFTPHSPDEGSVEPKSYSVDFSINLFFHLYYAVINFLYILSHYYALFSSIYIYIYIDVCVCASLCVVGGRRNYCQYLWSSTECLEGTLCLFCRKDHTNSRTCVNLQDQKKKTKEVDLLRVKIRSRESDIHCSGRGGGGRQSNLGHGTVSRIKSVGLDLSIDGMESET